MTNPLNPIDTVKALVDALDDVITQVKYYEQGTSAITAGRALLAQMQSHPSDERKAAEHEYACTAFDYPSAPVGSRDWTLFWKGWQAARALGPVKAQQEPAAWMHKGGMKVMPADEKAAYEQAPDDFSREIAAEYSTPLYTTAARALGPVKAQQEPQGKVQLPDKARAGIEELHRVVESLLTTSRYVDEEGEATQALADLSDCIADPPFRLAAHQGAQPAVPSDIADGIKGPHNACMFREHCRSLLAAAPSASAQPQECVELDAAGIPKIPMTLLEQKAVATCNTIKAWLDSGLSMPFPDDGREGVEVVLMFAAARREGVR
jgi:hypothetical protein